MAHNICDDNAIFYVGEKPWHGIGTELKNPATAEEAIISAKLNYNIELTDLHTSKKTLENHKATIRTDNHNILGVVSPKYQIIQNQEAFGFFDAVVGQKLAIYHTAGALGLGERIWLLAKLPSDIIVKGNDVVEKYLCLTSSHDGKSALRMYFTPIRVVCQNTLNASLQRGEGISIRHSGDIQLKVAEAQRILGISIEYYKEFEGIIQNLAQKPFNTENAELYFKHVLFGQQIPEEMSTQAENKLNKMLYLFDKGKGNDLPGIRHTAWAAYNAVTEMVDHHGTIKNMQSDPTNRLKNIWFGAGANLKERAFEEAVALL